MDIINSTRSDKLLIKKAKIKLLDSDKNIKEVTVDYLLKYLLKKYVGLKHDK